MKVKKNIYLLGSWLILCVYFITILWFTYDKSIDNTLFLFVIVLGWIVLFSTIVILSPFLFPSKLLSEGKLSAKEVLEYNHKLRMGVISSLLVGLAGIYFSWEKLNDDRENLNLTQKATFINLSQTQQREIANYYSKALVNLSSNNFISRLGAIYSLERIARLNAADYYWPVLHVLTAYIREYSPASAHNLYVHPKDDVVSIIEFIKEDKYDMPHSGYDRIDLSNADLSYTDFQGANLEYANFDGSILKYADFSKADLSNSSFNNANLEHAKFTYSKMSEASFNNADLKGSVFFEAYISNSHFLNAKFGNSEIGWLMHAKLYDVNFCSRYNVDKGITEYQCAVGLDCKDFKVAVVSNETVLPNYIRGCQLHRVVSPGEKNIADTRDYIIHHDMEGLKRMEDQGLLGLHGRLLFLRRAQ